MGKSWQTQLWSTFFLPCLGFYYSAQYIVCFPLNFWGMIIQPTLNSLRKTLLKEKTKKTFLDEVNILSNGHKKTNKKTKRWITGHCKNTTNEPNLGKLNGTQPKTTKKDESSSDTLRARSSNIHWAFLNHIVAHSLSPGAPSRNGQRIMAFLGINRYLNTTSSHSATVSMPIHGSIHLLLISEWWWYDCWQMNSHGHQLQIPEAL